jgi:anti-sigma-K factor RskA
MIDERQEENACLHALGLLETGERSAFVAELGLSPELRRKAGELREAALSLSLTAPEATPPDALRARILASAGAQRRPPAEVPAKPTHAKIFTFPAWLPWLAAACIAGAALWSQRQYAHEREANLALSAEQRLARLALEETREQLAEAKRKLSDSGRQLAELSATLKEEGDLAHFKIATLASMLGNSPEALAVAVWDPSRQQGVLTVSKLPALASGKDYQLWLVDKQYPNPVNAGVFVVDPVSGEAHIVFKAEKHVDSIAKFAVSLERKGGVPKAEGPIVLLSP